MDENLWADIARAGDGRTQESAPGHRDIGRIIMKMSTKRIAVAALICIVVGTISAVAVTVGRVYYWGTSQDGTRHFFRSEGGEGALGNGFITVDANTVTDVDQKAADLEEMKALSQQGKKVLLRVEETAINGVVDMIMHEYRYTLSDGRIEDMREGMKWGGGFDDKNRWQEWRGLRDAGPGQDLGTEDRTVDGRVFSFTRARYTLGDGTEITWSVGTPKGGR